MISKAFLDWNGVLLADGSACFDTDNHMLKTFGGNLVDFKTFRDTIVIPSIDFYVMHGCNREQLERDSKEVSKVFHAYFEKRESKCRTRKGAREVLYWLRENSIETIIVTNHTVAGLELQLSRLKLKEYFSAVEANPDGNTSMHTTSKLEKVCRHYSRNEGALILGDSPEEVKIGKELGIPTVAITGGYYSTKRLRQSQPDYLINNWKELIGVIKEIR
ncbi:MAG: HAD hydrolase-like protein [Candidatus Woesearchaeota archaeon]